MEVLKEFREKLGLTQIAFAENIGVSFSYYTKVENRNEKTK